jgi:glycosyltransferase involved in cell wall biosynthesis
LALLRVLTLATLFPNAAQPNHGVFVAGQTVRLAAHPGVDLRVVSPIGLPPLGLAHFSRYHELADLPLRETFRGVRVDRPRYTVLPKVGGPLNPALIAGAVRPVLRRLKREGFAPDVIDAEFFYPDGPAAMRLAREIGVPFSVKARGADIHYWGARRGCRAQVLAAADAATGLLSVAQSLKRDMAAMGMAADKIRVHYTGVDFTRFTVAPDRPRSARPTVVSVGALIPRKGHDIVIRALSHVPDARLLIAGVGAEREELIALARQTGVGERVQLLGDVPHDRIPALLADADAMALASRSEGLANAWVEALAVGTPIVIPDVDGAREVIDRPEAGRLVERTPEAFAAGIRAILASPPPRAAVRLSADRFAWERNTEALYEHLMMCAGRG